MPDSQNPLAPQATAVETKEGTPSDPTPQTALAAVLARAPASLEAVVRSAQDTLQKLDALHEEHDIRALKSAVLGGDSPLSSAGKALASADIDAKRTLGKIIGEIREHLNSLFKSRLDFIENEKRILAVAEKVKDPTLPSVASGMGGYHPVTLFMRHLATLFMAEGFVVTSGREIETTYYNFEALNIPPEHPARSAQDTFYLQDDLLLRTHTSNMQVHFMEQGSEQPFKMASLGRVYRRDSDVTHSPMFHQVEGLVVGVDIDFAALKYTLEHFLSTLFHSDIKVRYRPSYFPFTEPSVEVDIACIFCAQKGCNICKHSGYLEVLGAGMVHPAVLESVGIDAQHTHGFAFGIGVERLLMLYHGIPDMRLIYENHLPFLKQFH